MPTTLAGSMDGVCAARVSHESCMASTGCGVKALASTCTICADHGSVVSSLALFTRVIMVAQW